MTPEQLTTLEEIKASCRLTIELAEKATERPWMTGDVSVYADDSTGSLIADCYAEFALRKDRRQIENTTYIAHTANTSPEQAKMLLLLIAFCESDLDHSDYAVSSTAAERLLSIIQLHKNHEM